MSARDPKPIPADIGEFLSYEPNTGFLWRKLSGHKSRAGDRADYQEAAGYCRVRFGGGLYLVHRVAYFLMTGDQPPALLDHRDTNRANNRWSNLRAADHSQNVTNRVERKQSGLPKGVRKSSGTAGRFTAQITSRGVFQHLGSFGSAKEAHEAYRRAASILHGEFARFE